MAHFFTRHEMKKFDKKLSEENYLDTNRFKTQLKDEISKDNHRVNIDSAKKKAVLQHMNYDGFHQMVLGADLKGIKKGEIYSIGGNKDTIMNNISIQNKYNKIVDFSGKNFTVNQENNSKTSSNIFEENETNFNQKTFIKELKQINSSTSLNENATVLNENLSNKLFLLKKLGDEKFENILDEAKLPSDIFLDLLNSFGEIFSFFLELKEINSICDVYVFLSIFLKSKFYTSLKIFIGKKQKSLYLNLMQIIEKLISESSEGNEKEKLLEISNFLKEYFK